MKATVNESANSSAVPTAEDDSESLLESTYLLRSPANARRLVDAIESARAWDVVEHDLIIDDKALAPPDTGSTTSCGRDKTDSA